jgi:hypothetical protein
MAGVIVGTQISGTYTGAMLNCAPQKVGAMELTDQLLSIADTLAMSAKNNDVPIEMLVINYLNERYPCDKKPAH